MAGVLALREERVDKWGSAQRGEDVWVGGLEQGKVGRERKRGKIGAGEDVPGGWRVQREDGLEERVVDGGWVVGREGGDVVQLVYRVRTGEEGCEK